jgi:SAM-dependent methyltransferase
VIVEWLVERGVLPGAEILDAGCGTGRYTIELGRRGYVVHGVDRSPDLIDVAMLALGDSMGRVSFGVGDITHLPHSRYAAILCRGVLNDIIDDAGRNAVFAAFAETLQSHGALILDVREWAASAERKIREPLFRKRVSTDRGELTFTSVTALDPESRQLRISERHELTGRDEERVSDFDFVMRCWEREELNDLLGHHGFGRISWFGAYDAGIAIGATDRLVVVAQRSDAEA